MLTIAYFTNRIEPHIEWFADSLEAQTFGIYEGIRIVVVDTLGDDEKRKESFASKFKTKIIHCTPMPNVWQGKHRLTKQDYFAASIARNTAICHAEDGYLAIVDDLSVLLPGWLTRVKAAQAEGVVFCGAYEKVLGLQVVNGAVTGYRRLETVDNGITKYPGMDTRDHQGYTLEPQACGGTWFYGASAAFPVEGALQANGFDDDTASMGSEDYVFGFMLEQLGYKLFYDRRMRTLESEEGHHTEEDKMLRIIKKTPLPDASHAMLNMVLGGGRKSAPNYFGEGGIRELRQKILAGEPFPIFNNPQHDWRDGQPLVEM